MTENGDFSKANYVLEYMQSHDIKISSSLVILILRSAAAWKNGEYALMYYSFMKQFSSMCFLAFPKFLMNFFRPNQTGNCK